MAPAPGPTPTLSALPHQEHPLGLHEQGPGARVQHEGPQTMGFPMEGRILKTTRATFILHFGASLPPCSWWWAVFGVVGHCPDHCIPLHLYPEDPLHPTPPRCGLAALLRPLSGTRGHWVLCSRVVNGPTAGAPA